MRRATKLGCIALAAGWAVSGVAAEPLAEAKAKIAQCIEKEGEEYIEARNWLIEHPEALELLDENSWKQRWVKRICQGWMEHRELYERAMQTFEYAEIHGRSAVRPMVPSARSWAKDASRFCGDKIVPLMVECLWKTGGHWRHFKAWRIISVVEYLKLEGDRSVLDPAVEVLVSRVWNGKQAPDPASEYPRMDRFTAAGARTVDELAPYSPAQLIVEFGDQDTLQTLESLSVGAEISDASKEVLRTTMKLLEKRLDQKKRGEPLEEVDLAVEFGDCRTLEDFKVWEEQRGYEPFKQRLRERIERLEKRLEAEKKAKEGSEKGD